MNMKMEEVAVPVFIAKKNMLRLNERMGGHNVGTERNGHTKTTGWPERK
jgi:hypothetical protein